VDHVNVQLIYDMFVDELLMMDPDGYIYIYKLFSGGILKTILTRRSVIIIRKSSGFIRV
jgi:hypothetical protein